MSVALREEFNKLKAETVEIINKAKSENRDLTPEEREQNDRRFARCDSIKSILKDEKRAAELSIEFSDAVKELAKGNVTQKAEEFVHEPKPGNEKFRSAVNAFLRGENRPELFTLISTTGSSVFLPSIPTTPSEIRRIPNVILAALQARGIAPLYTPGTETIPVPIFDDSSNEAANTAEDSSSEVNQDPTVSSVSLGATLYDSKTIWLSNTMALAPGYDVLGYCEPILQKRVDRKMLDNWMTDLADNSTVGKTTTGSTTGVTFTEILDWVHSIPVPYRTDVVYFGSDGLFKALRSLTDQYGRPIYIESLASDKADTLLGAPFFVSDLGVDEPAAGKVVGVAASAEALKVRVCNNRRLTKYVNIPGHGDQTGLELFMNAGFAYISSGVRSLKMKAS